MFLVALGLLQFMTLSRNVSLNTREVSVHIFQYMPYLARDVRDKLIVDT